MVRIGNGESRGENGGRKQRRQSRCMSTDLGSGAIFVCVAECGLVFPLCLLGMAGTHPPHPSLVMALIPDAHSTPIPFLPISSPLPFLDVSPLSAPYSLLFSLLSTPLLSSLLPILLSSLISISSLIFFPFLPTAFHKRFE